ncbi:MAG TPA: glycosyltransferase family 39 protein [Solirubrobacteraceae bacterium]|nr:glycosyltransferase family 39 protein [Solirubrobacteraceae bacterium]
MPPPSHSPGEPGEGRRDPRWARPALIVLLAITAAAYLWDLSASGYANSFYAASVQAGTKSWKALFFGSLDSANFITVDKPPASMWVMALSGRIFGFSSWSMLVPQALEGVAAVALLYAAVKRWFGAGAGLVAGALFAATPVAALMFRFNNPDALLVLLLVASGYCLTRALERAGTRWIVAAGALVGAAFLAKMMQAFLVLPAFALVYAIAAPTTLRRRLLQLLAGGLALVVSAGWWVLAVALWPVGSRPMIDGSPDNSIFNLITGYNGLGRIFGSGSGPGGGGGGGSNFSGATGVLRLFNDLMGGQASWLLPAALVALVAGLWTRRHAPRTDRTRAALLLWGGWLLVTGAVFSFGQGVIHTYYTVALAPAIAALVAIGAALWWRRRTTLAARLLGALVLAGSAAWACVLLGRTPSWNSWLTPAIAVTCALAVAGLLGAPLLGHLRQRVAVAAVVLGIVSAVSGPLAYAAYTVSTPHTGSIVSAGPSTGGIGTMAGGGGGARPGAIGGTSQQRALFGSSTSGGGTAPSRAGGGSAPGGLAGGSQPRRGAVGGAGAAGASGSAPSGGGGGAGGGGGGGVTVSAKLVEALRSDASSYRWAAATSGSQSAASLELASGQAVMAIGGFNNEGGNLSLSAFEKYVERGEIHYYVASQGGGGGGVGGGPGGAGSSSTIASWVKAHFKTVTLGATTVYDLTARK